MTNTDHFVKKKRKKTGKKKKHEISKRMGDNHKQ